MKLRIGILLLLVAIVGWFVVVRPQIKVFGDKLVSFKAADIERKSYQQRVKDIEWVIANSQTVQPVLDSRYLALPRTSQIPEVLVMIESMGNASGITFSAATVSKAAGSEVPVSLSFSGTLSTVTTFEDTLYKNIRPVIVKTQTINSDISGNMSVTMQLGLAYLGGGTSQ